MCPKRAGRQLRARSEKALTAKPEHEHVRYRRAMFLRARNGRLQVLFSQMPPRGRS